MNEPVFGAEELRRAFLEAGTSFNREMRGRIAGYAEPVRADAEVMALSEIRNLGVKWSRMRKGTAPAIVYVAPVQRGTRILSRKRPKLAPLLMERAMVPALDRNRTQIVGKVDALLGRMERKFGGA